LILCCVRPGWARHRELYWVYCDEILQLDRAGTALKLFLTSFLKSAIPALLHPRSRYGSRVSLHSTSGITPTRIARGTERAEISKLMASKKTADEERALASKGAPSCMPRNPEVRPSVLDEHQSRHATHDRIILERLLSGDTRALAAFLLAGHIPGPTVRQCLALMLLDWPEAKAAVAAKPALNQQLWQLPFRLIAKSRPRSRRRQRGAEKTVVQGDNVNRLVEELGYDAAIARVNEAVSCLIDPSGRANLDLGDTL
jgi:hypothetical protein